MSNQGYYGDASQQGGQYPPQQQYGQQQYGQQQYGQQPHDQYNQGQHSPYPPQQVSTISRLPRRFATVCDIRAVQ